MKKSRLSKIKQDKLIEHFVAGTTARCASSLVGVNFKTACYYFHRIREINLGAVLDNLFKVALNPSFYLR